MKTLLHYFNKQEILVCVAIVFLAGISILIGTATLTVAIKGILIGWLLVWMETSARHHKEALEKIKTLEEKLEK